MLLNFFYLCSKLIQLQRIFELVDTCVFHAFRILALLIKLISELQENINFNLSHQIKVGFLYSLTSSILTSYESYA